MNSLERGIAVTGLACRFPGAPDAEAFWRLLIEGRDAVGPLPNDRFDPMLFDDRAPGEPGNVMSRRGGVLPEVDRFDAAFFEISPREAAVTDPQHRLLLEIAWEAIEDAGLTRRQLAGSKTGVFVGLWTNDYERLVAPSAVNGEVDVFAATGTGRYGASGRLSYAFDLRGPSIVVDTACSSSLVAVHAACLSLQVGECDIALVAAANLILDPLISIAYSRSGLLSREGLCRFGDAEASGYVRSEGAGVLVLRRQREALAAGDRVRAVILASGTNNDGRASGSLVAPSESAQAALLREVYAAAGIDPRTVDFLEAHGTGTRVGDPAELRAFIEVFGRPGPPCLVGSVKTNIGHTEAAAGLAGLIKTILALQHRTVPPSLHLRTPHPQVDLGPSGIRLCTRATPLSREGLAIAGVSAFGITGTNAHVVVQQAPEEPVTRTDNQTSFLVPVSARSEVALAALLNGWREKTWSGEFAHVACTAATRRTHHAHRRAIVAGNFDELRAALSQPVARDADRVHEPGTVVFVFPGQGSQWLGMGRQLLATDAIAREALESCDAALAPFWRHSACDLLDGTTSPDLEDVAIVQPLLFAVQVMLARVWMSWGVRPAACIGHSMGEVAAAHIAGVLSLEEAGRVISLRSALLRRVRGLGAMALVDATEAEALQLIGAAALPASVAAINDNRSVVISGTPDAVDSVIARFERDGRFCRRVSADVAAHSPQMDALVPPLLESLGDLRPAPSTGRLYSTAGDYAPSATFDAAYWARNLRAPVRFAAACGAALADGHRTFVEISPHPILTHSTAEVARDADVAVTIVGSLRRGADERSSMLRAAGELFEAGLDLEWMALYPVRCPVVDLPAYAWQRERFWTDNRARTAPRTTTSGSVRASGASGIAAEPAARIGSVFEIAWSEVSVGPPLPAFPTSLIVVGDEPGRSRIVAAAERGGIRAFGVGLEAAEQGADWRGSRPAGADASVVVFLAPAGTSSLDTPWVTVEPAFTELLDRFIGVVRALSGDSSRSPLWVVTRRGQAADGAATPVDPIAASLIGLARVVWEEHPALAGGTIDLGGEVDRGTADAVVAHVLSANPIRQVALRNGRRLTPRFVHSTCPAATVGVHADSTYLITGGLGGVGLAMARRLVARGARHLALVGRSGLPSRDEWATVDATSELGRRIAGVRDLEFGGAAVRVIAVDVATRDALDAALRQVERDSPRIAGVIHAAATVRDTLVERTVAADLLEVARPKAAGAWHLQQYFAGRPLDFFVTCSSIGALVGLTGQASYAASNALVDALAHSLRASGRCATSINWGGWKDVGLARTSAGARSAIRDLAEDGLDQFDAERGLDAFERIIGADLTQASVMSLLPEIVSRSARIAAEPELFRGIVPPGATVAESRPEAAALRQRLLELPPPGQRALLGRALKGELARIIRLTAADIGDRTPLGTLGLESLMGLELHRWLESSLAERLPKTVVWRHPTVAALCDFLLARLQPEGSMRDTTVPVSQGPHVVEAISERDALAALLSEDGLR